MSADVDVPAVVVGLARTLRSAGVDATSDRLAAAVEAARASIRRLRAMNRLLDRLDLTVLAEAQARQDELAAQNLVYELLLGELAVAA